MVEAREQEHTHRVCVSVCVCVCVCVDACDVSIFVRMCTCLYVCVCAVQWCLVKVSSSSSTGSRPSHGSSADFAEWLVARHTAPPMTSSNEN